MYAVELEIKDPTESITSASYLDLDLLLTIGRDGQLQTSEIKIPTSQTFRPWVVIFHHCRPMAFLSLSLYDQPGLAPHEYLILMVRRTSSKLLKQGYIGECLQSSFRKFYGRYGDLIK